MADLEIRNLHVQAGDKKILKGLDLTVNKGEIHALMGPNGSGKSTLANVIMGQPNLEVTEGQILFRGEDITEADPDERARMGLFMAFQYPVAIPGVTVTKYLRMVMNAHREARGEAEISLKEFRKTVEAAMELTNVPRDFTTRYLNEGFSGGEKKRMEILQLALQQPAIAILDETDSGLDIDALNTVSHGVNTVAGQGDMGVLIITHYQRILHMVQPQRVSIMFEGRIVKEGGPELVEQLERQGYGWVRDEVAAAARWTTTTSRTARACTAASTRCRSRRRSCSRARGTASRGSSAGACARRSSRATSPRR
jgi:Fe-S cluster assembly ATP-binding protein